MANIDPNDFRNRVYLLPSPEVLPNFNTVNQERRNNIIKTHNALIRRADMFHDKLHTTTENAAMITEPACRSLSDYAALFKPFGWGAYIAHSGSPDSGPLSEAQVNNLEMENQAFLIKIEDKLDAFKQNLTDTVPPENDEDPPIAPGSPREGVREAVWTRLTIMNDNQYPPEKQQIWVTPPVYDLAEVYQKYKAHPLESSDKNNIGRRLKLLKNLIRRENDPFDLSDEDSDPEFSG